MKITTPTATLGIRGTTGVVEVPEGATANNREQRQHQALSRRRRTGRPYRGQRPRSGARLGALTQGASGFAIRPAAPAACASPRCRSRFRRSRCARPGFRAPGALRRRPRRPADRAPSSATSAAPIRLRQSEPTDPAIPARPAAAEWPAGAKQARTASARSVESSRSAATERPARTTRSAATADRTESPGTTAAWSAQPPRTAATARSVEPARSTATTGRAKPPGTAAAGRRRGQPGCRTGTAFPDCSGRPAFRARLPCSGRDCPPRRSGPRRNAASRRLRNCGSAQKPWVRPRAAASPAFSEAGFCAAAVAFASRRRRRLPALSRSQMTA